MACSEGNQSNTSKYVYKTESDANTLSELLATDTTLKSLMLDHHEFSVEDVRILTTGLKLNNTLESLCVRSWDHPLSGNNFQLIVDAIDGNTSLKILNLHLGDLTEDDVETLTNLSRSKVSQIIFTTNTCHPAAIVALLSVASDISLSIDNGSLMLKRNLVLKRNFCELTRLSAEETESAINTIRLNKSITKLEIIWCEANMEVVHNAFDENSSIKNLSLYGVPCSSEDFTRLLDYGLEKLHMSSTGVEDISLLKYNTTLKSYTHATSLQEKQFDTKHFEEILLGNNTLLKLDLSFTFINNYEGLIKGLSVNNTLEELELPANISLEVANSIVESLEYNYSLQRIAHVGVNREISRLFSHFLSDEQREERMSKLRRFACTKSSRL